MQRIARRKLPRRHHQRRLKRTGEGFAHNRKKKGDAGATISASLRVVNLQRGMRENEMMEET